MDAVEVTRKALEVLPFGAPFAPSISASVSVWSSAIEEEKMGWRDKMEKAKRRHRPSLKDWEQDGLYHIFPSYLEKVMSEESKQFLLIGSGSTQQQEFADDIPKILPVILDARTLTKMQFCDEYESKEIPCVIQNIPAGFDDGKPAPEWAALRRWDINDALHDDRNLQRRTFKCGEDDDGRVIYVKLKHFLSYLHKNHDDSPLYIFDSHFDDDRYAKSILNDYRVPSYFDDDLFKLISEKRRPPYRWFLLGPQRSGTCVHIDPLGTSAWNTLIRGAKRWVLFPPHVPKRIVKGKGLLADDEDDEAIHYFMYILPRIRRRAAENQDHPDYRDFACYEFTQHEGETVFVPTGWWHAVLNLTNTVGITQNYCSPRNFDKVWLSTRSGRKRMAWKWLCKLEEKHPHLAERARQLNRRDNFRMKYDPVEIRRQEILDHRRKMQRTV